MTSSTVAHRNLFLKPADMTQDSEHFTSESNYKGAHHVTIWTNGIAISCYPENSFSHRRDKIKG